MGLKTKLVTIRKLPKTVKKLIFVIIVLALFSTNLNISVFAFKREVPEVKQDQAVEEHLDENTHPSEIPILFEDESKRDAYTKHFRKLDGSYEVSIYNEPVHYLENNEWKEIDNSLLLDVKSDEYENKANNFNFKLPKKIHENKTFKLSYDKYQLDWTIKDIKHTNMSIVNNEITKNNSNNLRLLNNINQTTYYEAIQPNVNLEYIIKGNQIKENIILEKYIENYSLTYVFKTKGLVIKEIDGEIVFLNELDEEVFSFGSLYMFDSNLTESTAIEIKVNQRNKNEYELTIIPDDKWLKDSERVYPVTVDPTIVIGNGDNLVRDRYTYGSSFYEALDLLKLGKLVITLIEVISN